MLEDSEVDGVLLATPIFTHYELARRCLEADELRSWKSRWRPRVLRRLR